MTIYIFDGTLEGLLTAVFEFYEQKPGKIQLVASDHFQPVLLDETFEVISDEAKAKRVWTGLKKKINTDWQQRFYKAYLSEDAATFQHLFDFACYIFDNAKGAEQNFGHPSVMAISKMDRSVNREKHRMKAFIRFQETADGIFYAPVSPDFNVLPLIIAFFRNLYADQRWIIYDLKRKYGLYYDLEKVEEIQLDVAPILKNNSSLLNGSDVAEKEGLYGLLWNDYFKSTNIPARKNMKLHVRHVPKRYWKYLSEKQPSKSRYFIALVPPKNISDAIMEFKRDFADNYQSSYGLKIIPHITLKTPFEIFETDHQYLVDWFGKLNASIKPFSLTLKNFGSFKNRDHPVIFIQPQNTAALNDLQKNIIQKIPAAFPSLSIESTDSHFTPHLTVAYRDLKPDKYDTAWEHYKNRQYDAVFTVESFCLLRHDGVRWNIVATKSLNDN